ncbi:MAG: hypothetical protein JNN07_08665 [Verrucomicrobiales bacterium]|nr:hypothetical protein [Verrucomicrobiales bacterium]
MIRCLLGKELRQHSLTLALLWGALALVFIGLSAGHSALGMAGSRFDAVRTFLLFGLSLGALTLGQLLVASEFQHRVPVFVEGLPLSRGWMFGVKFVLGATFLEAVAVAALGGSVWMGRYSEWITSRFLWILLSTTMIWTVFVWAAAYLTAFLGRYRFLAWGALLAVAGALGERFKVDLQTIPPLSLLGIRFGYEGLEWDSAALGITLTVAAGLFVAALWLGASQNGDRAAALARPMKLREKLNLTAVVGMVIMLFTHHLTQEERKQPLLIPGSEVLREGKAVVEWSSAAPLEEARDFRRGHELMERLAKELAALGDYLQAQSLPHLVVIHRADLGPQEFKRGELDSAQGCLVRVNLLASDLDERRFFGWVTEQCLIAKSHGRATLESRAWVLDGFVRLWSERDPAVRTLQLGTETKRVAQSLAPQRLDVPGVRRWRTLVRDQGTNTATAAAALGLASLGEGNQGDGLRRFLAHMLGRETPKDWRAWLRDLWSPPSSVMRTTTGVRFPEFVERWQQALANAPPSGPLPP